MTSKWPYSPMAFSEIRPFSKLNLRNIDIVLDCLNGLSQSECSKKYNLNNERIRQIFKVYVWRLTGVNFVKYKSCRTPEIIKLANDYRDFLLNKKENLCQT